MESEGNHDEEAKADELYGEADLHDIESQFLCFGAIGSALNTTQELDEEGQDVA